MTEGPNQIAEELAYVRTLAEEGRFAPLVGGELYVLWGGLTALAALATWLDAIDLAPFDGRVSGNVWIGAVVIGWAASFVLGARARRKPGATTVGNRTANAAWLGVGVFITLFFISILFVHDDYARIGLPRFFLFSLMFPVAFGLYGVAFLATASAARVPWFRFVSVLAWGFAIALMFLLASPHQMLVAAMGSLACAVAPGVMLLRREPRGII